MGGQRRGGALSAAARPGADTLALGDTIRFRGARWTVTAFNGERLFLDPVGLDPVGTAATAEPLVILQTAVTCAADFAVLDRAAPRSELPGRSGEFRSLPPAVRRDALRWERQVKEVLHQQAPNVAATTVPKATFDPRRYTLRQRYQAKAVQLTRAGWSASVGTVERKCTAWRKKGLLGLADRRSLRTASPHGRVDPRVISMVWEILDDERARGLSPGTLSRLICQVQQMVRERHGDLLADPATRKGLLNSPATLYRLLDQLGITAQNAHAAAARRAATTARAAERRGAWRATMARWPGELVQIDTTGLDVLALGDDGQAISVELTIAIDVATRSVVGSLIVPRRLRRTAGAGRWLGGRATRSFDTMQVLAQATAPLPARPGWAPETFMDGSDLPFEELLAADARFAGAAARPVIKPETLVIDHGSPFISEDFTRACHSLGIEVREARLRTPVDKAIVERAMRAVKTGFSQHLAAYTHHRLDLRGKKVRKQPLWTIAQLQELFEQWVVLRWQQTPHGALRSPFTPGVCLSPNKMYAALVFQRGYRAVTLGPRENRKLLPAVWVRVGRKGFQINNRTYNLGRGALDAFRGPSGLTAQQDRWEVHYSPDHPDVAWLFNHQAEPGGDPWVEVPFIHRRLLDERWTEETWAEGLRLHLAAGGSRRDEAAITRATARLLRTAGAGPQPGAAPGPTRPAVAPRPVPPAAERPYAAGLPPLDPQSVRPFRTLNRPAGELFDTPEPARGGSQSLDDFLASLPGPGAAPRPVRTRPPCRRRAGQRTARRRPVKTSVRNPKSAPPPQTLLPPGQPSTLPGWRARVRHVPGQPPAVPDELPSPADGNDPGIDENDPRVRYHAQLGLVETTDIVQGTLTARRLLRLNKEQRHCCPHIAIDSDCRGTGKRTLLHHIGLGHQGRREKLHGINDDLIPVVCLNTPPEPGTPADWSAALAVFLGWDLYRPDIEQRPVQRMKDFTGPAVQVMRQARTEICLIDGIDRLRSEDLQPTFDYFDYLADELGLTVFWSGIGSSDILREARTARFSALRRPAEATAALRPRAVPTLRVNRLPPRSEKHPEEWASTVAALDGRLSLRHHRPLSLLEQEEDIYRITDGLMEHLTPLIGMAGQLAILDRTEAITPDVLNDAARYLDLPLPNDNKPW
ncbi:hypothetical protein ABCR94_13930 [Streptomyces sp. 21So2-11]|uniref:hypothetical protein n=1 Tax=Streptomyces sp. 21So2-11 TaxID=3144408 RepID=UPI00321A616B